MTSPFVHVFFNPGESMVIVALESSESDCGFGVVVNGAPRAAEYLAGAVFPPPFLPALYCFNHDFTAAPDLSVQIYHFSLRGEPRLVLASTYDLDPPSPPARESAAGARWTTLAIGFQTGARDGHPIFASSHRVVTLRDREILSSPEMDFNEALTRKLSIAAPSRTFTPLFIWAARAHGDAAHPASRSGPMTLVKPAGSSPLHGEPRASLEWRFPPAPRARAGSALEAAMRSQERPTAVFRIELAKSGVAAEILDAALASSVRVAHVSLKQAGVAATLQKYREDRSQEHSYAMQRVDPDRAESMAWRARAPAALRAPGRIDPNAPAAAIEIAVSDPGLGDIFIVYWRPELLTLAASDMPRLKSAKQTDGAGAGRHAGESEDKSRRPFEELWFIAAGTHLLWIDRDHAPLANELGVSSIVERIGTEVERIFREHGAFENATFRLQAKFVARATESEDPCTAAAFGRAGSGLAEIIRAQSLTAFLREIAIREDQIGSDFPKASRSLVLECFSRSPALVSMAALLGLLDNPGARALLRISAARAREDGAFLPAHWLTLLGEPAAEAARLDEMSPLEHLRWLAALLGGSAPPAAERARPSARRGRVDRDNGDFG